MNKEICYICHRPMGNSLHKEMIEIERNYEELVNCHVKCRPKSIYKKSIDWNGTHD